MKTSILTLTIVLLVQLGFAQCDQQAVLNFNQVTEARNNQTGIPVKLSGTINLEKEAITITIAMNGRENKIFSKIKSTPVCNWQTFLKDGNAKYLVSSRKREEGEEDNASIVFKSINGITQVTFLPESPGASAITFDITDTALH